MTSARIYRFIFVLAGLYNIIFGLWAALFPYAFFRWIELGEPSHPAIWACLGMVVGLYGLVYLQVAFTEPARRLSAIVVDGRRVEYDVTRWLIAIGLAGKILGPVGFLIGVRSGEIPVRLLSLLVFDDLIWWVPFAMYLIDDTTAAGWIKARAPRLCAIVHAVTAVASWFWIRGGSEAVADPAARAAFIGAHAATWRAGWMLWMVSAVTLVGFFCWWAARSARARLAALALGIAFAGLAADFYADALFIAWMPDRYADVAAHTTLVSEVAANGLYSLAGVLLMLAGARIPTAFAAFGWTIWIAGFTLAAFGAVRWDAGIVASAAILMTLFIPWSWLANERIRRA